MKQLTIYQKSNGEWHREGVHCDTHDTCQKVTAPFTFTVMFHDTWKGVTSNHGTFATYEEAWKSITDWWDKHDFEPYYVRKIMHARKDVFDYGNHYGFYHIIFNRMEQ